MTRKEQRATMDWEKALDRWVEARLVDPLTASRIRDFESSSGRKGLRWPAILAVSFGALMLSAGVLLFVAAHWDELSPSQRFTLVLSMVALFHLAAGLLGSKVPSVGIALHLAGTISLGAGIYLAGQIFNLEEHWPGGIMLWALGAVVGWLVLKQWPQALMAALLIPWWIAGEWDVATERYFSGWNIAAQGLLLIAIIYLTTTHKESNRYLRLGLTWVGAIALLPFIVIVPDSATHINWPNHPTLPLGLKLLGYAVAYLPALCIVAITRKKQAVPVFAAAAWVFVLNAVGAGHNLEYNPWVYLWVAVGACAFCYWGMHDNRKLFINYGTAIFAIDVIAFYFSSVLDKLGRSMGLILLGVIFLAGGWVLNRLRTDLIARAAAAGGKQ
jgi:uncharacterized membrane protein